MSHRSFDPITLEVLWGRLIAIVDEAAVTLIRTSFSTVVRESFDFSCVLTDSRGNSLAQATLSIPSFIGTLPQTVKHFLRFFPEDTLRPGDVLITNDMWLGTGHLPDVNVAKPIFRDGKLIAWAASVAHAPDIGGKIRSPDPRDVFEEGLQIPPMKLSDGGKVDEVLLKLIRANVRVPDQVVGDLWAQLAALDVSEQRLLGMMEEYGLDEVDDLAAAIQGVSESAMRAAISALPDGDYVHELQTDGLAVPITLRLKLTVRGDQIHCDFTGSSDQVDRALNVVPAYRDAFTMYAVKCALSPHVPNNEGAFRPITLDAPEGSILNPRFPAAGGCRVLVGHYLPTLVFTALSNVIPDQVMAATGSPVWCVNVGGLTEKGRRVSTMFFVNGGTGAAQSRDGYTCLSFPSNVSNTPVEIMESNAPWTVESKALVPDSGGPGRHRGGLGQSLKLRIVSPGTVSVSFLAERTRFPAPGLFGGGEGGAGAVILNGQLIDPKVTHIVESGDLLELRTPGGGGVGKPNERCQAALQRDIEQGYVTVSDARKRYGANV
ncbi:MAG: hydantoinase B/oxoprolinase family protein [Chloroflexi bacterium]|nr:hydantoinase B/oxoprolinase family protein [Chloroflexota bacterium]